MDKKAKWVWIDHPLLPDTYASFFTDFIFEGCKTEIKILAETNYVLCVNGKVASFGQFAGFPSEKYYDVIDITKFVKRGKNDIKITVWYEGYNTFTHIEDGAGLIFTIVVDGKTVKVSDENILGGIDNSFVQNSRRVLTVQIGYTSSMINGGKLDYKKVVVTPRECVIKPRPIKKLDCYAPKRAELLSNCNGVYDLGKEYAGYAFIEVDCESDCTVTVAYGEYLDNGKVNRILPGGYKNVGRDFSLDFICKKGKNRFENYFIRLAGRYIQVVADSSVQVKTVGIVPVYYPLTEKKIELNGLDKKIYDTAVRTLRLCMHEHYEDCPWREQALYSLDSRNQMLCGYYAFKESEFQRANLVLLSKGKRSDGLLELTCPAIDTPSIPFFSLIYPVSVYEYFMHTGDESLIDEVWDTVSGIMQIFADRIEENGLIKNFPAPYWNFYEWTKGSDGNGEYLDKPHIERFDLILNCAFVYAYERFSVLCSKKGVKASVDTEKMKNAIKTFFYDQKRNRFFLSDVDREGYSQLGNAFALLIGLGNDDVKNSLKEDKTLIPATLSMLGFVYDALLANDNSNDKWILNDIREKYGYMLSHGATSFWETIEGVFLDKSNSLCHGWSAMPVYYYNRLKGEL